MAGPNFNVKYSGLVNSFVKNYLFILKPVFHSINLVDRACRECWNKFIPNSVTRFDEFSPFWQYFKSLRRLCEGLHLVLAKQLNLLWLAFYAIGQIFIVANGLILTNNITIWSHWSWRRWMVPISLLPIFEDKTCYSLISLYPFRFGLNDVKIWPFTDSLYLF